VSAAALRALHVPGTPLILPNAWDAGSAKLVAGAGFPVVATTSSGVAEALGFEDGELAPPDQVLGVVASITRAVDVPVTADMESGYGLAPAELAAALAAAGAAGLNYEDTDHARHPELRPVAEQAERIAAVKAAADLVLNARIDVHISGRTTEEGLERARAYLDAGADCVYPIGITDPATIERYVQLGGAVNVLLSPDQLPVEALAGLGVARISLGHYLHAAAMDAAQERLVRLSLRGTRS
jgi:2-methylisocitrate lyase-like PEP mutase family enzyme